VKRLYLLIIICLGLICGIMLQWPFEDDRLLWANNQHLQIIEHQLAGLKDALVTYRNTHGKYPDNNEGLTVLDSFEARIKLFLYVSPESLHETFGRGDTFIPSNIDERWWASVDRSLREFRSMHDGRAPTNMDEFCTLWIGRRCNMFKEFSKYGTGQGAYLSTEIAIDKSNNIFILSDAGILTPWTDPYIYENRTKGDQKRFGHSIVSSDKHRRFSIKVDNGIYVCSVGAYYRTKDYDSQLWERYGPRVIACIPVFAIAILGCVLRRKDFAAIIPAALFGLLLGTVVPRGFLWMS